MSNVSDANWQDVRLIDLAHYFNGVAFKPSDWSEDGLKIVRIEQLNNPLGAYDKYKGTVLEPNKIQDGDLIFSWSATLKVAIWMYGDAVLNQHLFKVVPKVGFDRRFIFFLLDYNMEALGGGSHGSTMKHIKRSELDKYLVRVPGLLKQRKIATILTSIDTAIEKTESLIAKYQKIKAGLMHDLFTRGVTADGKLRPPREQAPELYQETPIGWIPKEWQYEFLDELTIRGSGHTPNRNIMEYWNGGIKWISLADSYRLDKLYISDTDNQISKLGIQNSSAVMHPAGIVVMSRDAGIGKSAITVEAMAVSQHFMSWRCEHKMDNHFLYYWLQYKKRMFENIAMGSTILTIGLPFFKKLKISAPIDKDEQVEIGQKLKLIDQKIFSLESDLVKKRHMKYGLMQDLLTGKVSVNVEAPPLETPHV